MEPDEVLEIVTELEATLEELGYGSVVEQERRAAAEGRVVETTKDDRARFGQRGVPRPEVGDVRRTPLSVDERLAMLVDLAEAAVGATFAIEERVLGLAEQYFPKAVAEGNLPTFRPDFSEGFTIEDERSWSLSSRENLANRRSAVRRVLRDLDDLREAVGIPRDPSLMATDDDRERLAGRTLDWA